MLSRFHGKANRDNKEAPRSRSNRQGHPHRRPPTARPPGGAGCLDRQAKRTTDSPRGDTGHDGDNPAYPVERPGREACEEGEGEITRGGQRPKCLHLLLDWEYPHWMMMAGAILVTLGFMGFAFHQNRNGPVNEAGQARESTPTERG